MNINGSPYLICMYIINGRRSLGREIGDWRASVSSSWHGWYGTCIHIHTLWFSPKEMRLEY